VAEEREQRGADVIVRQVQHGERLACFERLQRRLRAQVVARRVERRQAVWEEVEAMDLVGRNVQCVQRHTPFECTHMGEHVSIKVYDPQQRHVGKTLDHADEIVLQMQRLRVSAAGLG
jgi:hypothetical protein